MFTYFFFIVILTKFIIDGAFSIKTILELVGVAGPVRRAGSVCNLYRNSGPTRGGGGGGGVVDRLSDA